MLPFTIEKGDCTGCTACYAICPVQCIEMKPDEEGFLYPTASDQCIHCNKCKEVCPQQTPSSTLVIKQGAFAACSNDREIWKRSSSGGAFSEICYSFGDSNTLFVGAAWNDFSVQHIGVGINNLKLLCKSKYIASDLGNTFNQIKKHLLQGEKVVFCGTPCQVAGLKKFLGKDYDKLLLIDLICHGVGSPKVFQSCIDLIENQLNDEIISYEFRAKRNIIETDYLSKVVTAKHTDGIYLVNDPYIQLFLQQQCLRPSCGKNCKYREEQRQGDITISDFKGLAYVFPQLAGSKVNYSSIITNTIKGAEIVSTLSNTMSLYPCEIEQIKKYNPLFYRQTHFSEKRDLFFNEYISCPDITVKNWTSDTVKYKKKITKKVYDLLPTQIRQKIWQLFHKKSNEKK